MKSDGELMEMLEAFDLTGSYRGAAEMVGCSHNTVKKAVEARGSGPIPLARRTRLIDDYLDVLEEWVSLSRGRIRGDKAHQRLQALGYEGADRTTRRALAEVKKQWKVGNARVHRPWTAEPGLWLQYDFGDGPIIGGRKVVLLVAWLAWSRYRVVIALHDRTAASVFAGLDRVFRIIGGAPTHLLTDNEKTVTTGHVAGVPVRNRQAVTFARFYGITVQTCMPADPASKGGSESSVKLAKADIVPTETNLLPEYDTFAQVERACARFTSEINARVHRVTRRTPVSMLIEEQPRLHQIPDLPHTAALGVTRKVPDNTPMVSFEHCQYSVPAHLLGHTVWIRRSSSSTAAAGAQVVISALDDGGPVEVARHQVARPGSPAIDDQHFPGLPAAGSKVPGEYRVRARTAAEQAFLALGEGAHLWLTEAAVVGVERIHQKMAHAVDVAALRPHAEVDWALGHAAAYGRFATDDLDSILAHRNLDTTTRTANESTSLAQGTAGWQQLGTTPTSTSSTSTERAATSGDRKRGAA